ncbi:Endonuclease/exonuclease/phosphatase [Trinorchestia longiramus]|nr:Endonuclease/exonuclease/phosphatase [Trinorchestia longiramus]
MSEALDGYIWNLTDILRGKFPYAVLLLNHAISEKTAVSLTDLWCKGLVLILVYHNVGKPLRSNRSGGFIMYIKEKLQPLIRAKRVTEKIEILQLTIHPHLIQTIKIVLVDKNPTCTVIDDDELYGYLHNLLSASHKTLIMGDFNLPCVNWTTRQRRAPGSKFIHLINTNSLQQHVSQLTRRNNILKLAMMDLKIIGLEITDKIGDHYVIEFHGRNPNIRTQHKNVLNYKRANLKQMKEEVSSIDYNVLMMNKNTEECYMTYQENIAPASERHIQTKQMRLTNNPPWFSQEIKYLAS